MANISNYNFSSLITELDRLINSALSDPLIMQTVVEKSVEHDNGFLKIVLRERDGSNYGLRIHKWKPDASDSNIHTHRWSMISFILQGGYDAHQYEEAVDGDSYYSYNFQPDNNGNYSLDLQKKVCLKKILRMQYIKGDSYQLKQGDIHEIYKVGNKGALTAIISWGEDSDTAKVYSSEKIEEAQSVQRKLSIDEIKACLNEVGHLIQKA